MKFVLFHGSFGGPEHNWFPDLKRNLELLGQEVISPRFPVDTWEDITAAGPNSLPKYQTLNNWTKEFERTLKGIASQDSLCFVGHSLGPLFILHMVSKFHLHLDSAIFVSPFLTKLHRSWQIDLVNSSFYKSDFNFAALKKSIPVSYAIYAKDDPYVSIDSAREFVVSMNSKAIESETGMHFNTEAKCTSLPLIYELCKTRIPKGNKQNYFSVV